MTRYLSGWFLLAYIALPAGAISAQGILQQLRDDVQYGVEDEDEESQPERHHHCQYDDCDPDSPWRIAMGNMICMGVTAPFWGPPVWCGDGYASTTYLSCYPYQHDCSGFVLVSPLPKSEYLFNWSLRVRGEYADDFDSMTRYGGRILWESRNRFGFDTSVDYRQEAIVDDRYDDLWTGDANVVFRFAQNEYLVMRSGLGVNYLSDDDGTDLGFNFTYGGDWFPMKPFIVSAEIDWGWIGKAGLFNARSTIGVNIQNIEVYCGFSYFDVGSAQIRGVISGLQLWY